MFKNAALFEMITFWSSCKYFLGHCCVFTLWFSVQGIIWGSVEPPCTNSVSHQTSLQGHQVPSGENLSPTSWLSAGETRVCLMFEATWEKSFASVTIKPPSASALTASSCQQWVFHISTWEWNTSADTQITVTLYKYTTHLLEEDDIWWITLCFGPDVCSGTPTCKQKYMREIFEMVI